MSSGCNSMRSGAPMSMAPSRPAPGDRARSRPNRGGLRMDEADAAKLDPQCRPKLPRGVRLKHDELRNEWVLLAPERMMKLNGVSVEILKRCTGEATLDAIIDDLAVSFAAPRERIAGDV